jgi:hypothetical protein
MIYIIGPGHGGPGLVAHTYLEGSYTELYPAIEQDRAGMRRLFWQFSWPSGIPSHVAPKAPGSIHERGELSYSLAHAWRDVRQSRTVRPVYPFPIQARRMSETTPTVATPAAHSAKNQSQRLTLGREASALNDSPRG